MLTFTDQQTLYQQFTQDFSTAGLAIAKRDINEGGAMFLNRLGRKFNKEYLSTGTVKDQQYYQFSSLVLRISEIRVLNGTNYYTPMMVTSEAEWNQLNTTVVKGSYPTHYYIRGFNEVGLYPIPSATTASAIQISYEPQHTDLTQDDYTTGTIAVTNGQTAITVTGGSFTQSMQGRWFQVTDGSDTKWYRIASFSSATVLNLENFYEGIGGGRTYRIGEVMKIPNGYQDAPVFFACERFYMTQNDQRTAPIFAQRFEMRLKSAKETYSRATSRMGSKTRPQGSTGFNNWIYLTKPIFYP